MSNAKSNKPGYATDFVKGDWDKATYLSDPNVDNLMTVVLNLGAEFWAMRRRQLVVEALLDRNKLVNAAVVEAYQPTDAERTAWAAERDDTIERIYSVLTRVSERTGGKPPQAQVPPLGV